MPGIIPSRPKTVTAVEPPKYPVVPGSAMEKSHILWNHQVDFDHKLHVERNLFHPQDAVPGSQTQDEVRMAWVWGESVAVLSELDEFFDALTQMNPEEECVDVLHFLMGLGSRLAMTPQEFGRFEDVFAKAQAECRSKGYTSFEQAYRGELPNYVKALNSTIRMGWKWWKAQMFPVDWKPYKDGLRELHHVNTVIASSVFATPEAMFNAYLKKVQENHQRQAGLVKGREDYNVAIPQAESPQVGVHVDVDYTNHAGKRAPRVIQPLRLRYGTTPMQDTPRWLVDAVDVERGVERSFSLHDVHSWKEKAE